MPRDDEIFAQVFELPADERAVFLADACAADPTQRARIEALLAADEAGGSFLDRSPGKAVLLAAEEKPGDVIGRYTLLEKIGEGGCGTVYRAEQKVPVQRKVALKVIKLGMDTRTVITRFEAERQALALMEHPDIARVFDAGATDAGRPFFVMELVTGEPITRFCDEHALSVPARLELFSRVCAALQHAHQKGIIHRDVKPSNILVTMRDGAPSPKVIDFGIAKATQERLTDETLVTAVDQFIGTPAYMSPEQADRRTADIDTRSDIYALGVLLYELLTGRLPFDPQLLAQAGVDELRRITREVEPLRPSVRLRTLGGGRRRAAANTVDGSVGKETRDQAGQVESRAGGPCQPEPTLAAIASARASSPLQLTSALKGDLDWIVMRCLEKDRERRYGSARELADDVQRYLHREPVRARPPSVRYLVERFVSRNRVACASAAAIALALVVGTVVSVRQAVRATRAEHVANAERDAAKAAGQAETLARADAQRRQEQAEDLLTFMLGDFRTELQKIGRLQLLDAVGEKAMAYFAALDARDLTDTALARQAKALTQIGEVRMDQARYTDAHTAFTTAYDRAAALAKRHPKNGDMLFERAQAEYWIGFVARKRGDFTAEREWLTRYRDSAVELVAVEGETKRAQLELSYGHHNLAVLAFDEGSLVEAQNGFILEKSGLEQMQRVAPRDLELSLRIADVISWLSEIAERRGQYAEAAQHLQEIRSIYEGLVQEEPSVAKWRYFLAQNCSISGRISALTGRREFAVAFYARAAELLRALTAEDPTNFEWRAEQLHTRLERVLVEKVRDGVAQVPPELSEIRSDIESLHQAESSSDQFIWMLSVAWRLEGLCWFLTSDFDQAGESIRRSLELSEMLVRAKRANRKTLGNTAEAHVLAGRVAHARGQSELAKEHWHRAWTLVSHEASDSSDCRLLDPAAQALVLLGRIDEAHPLILRLRQAGYCPRDPLAASIFAVASTQ